MFGRGEPWNERDTVMGEVCIARVVSCDTVVISVERVPPQILSHSLMKRKDAMTSLKGASYSSTAPKISTSFWNGKRISV